MPGPLLTTTEVAEIFGLTEKTLRNWRCLQQGPPWVKHRGRVYYRTADVDAYIAALPMER